MEDTTTNPNDGTQPVTTPPADTTPANAASATPNGDGANGASVTAPDNLTPREPNPDRSVKPASPPDGVAPSGPIAQRGVQDPNVKQAVDAAQNPVVHPAVQRAGLLHSIAQELAGGPRFKYETDVNTGQTKKTAVPLSGRQIAMAIALEAISGSLGGLKEGRGKGAGAAGVGGMQAGAKIQQARQQGEQQQEQDQQQNVARHYQVAEANMRMLSLAQTIGKMDQGMHDDVVKMSAPQLQELKDNSPELLAEQHLSEKDSMDLNKYPMHEYTRVADGVVPRMDANGNVVYLDGMGKVTSKDTPGAHPAFDNTYSLVHKTAKLSLSSADGANDYVKQGVAWGLLDKSWLNAAPGSEISAPMAIGIAHKVSSLNAANRDLESYYKTLNQGKAPSDQSASAAGSGPEIKDDKISGMIDDAASKYGISPAMLRALILTESGNPKTGEVNTKAVSPKGAKGLGQLMPATAKMLGVTDPFDAQQNINGTAKYLRDLLASKGDPKQALAAYHGIGSDGITTDSQYVNKIMKLAGLNASAPAASDSDAAAKYSPIDLKEELKKDPTLYKALEKFQGMTNATGSREQAIGELGKKDPVAAGKVARLYGGRDTLHEFDEQQKLSDQKRLSDQKTAEDLDKKKQEEGQIIQRNDKLIDAMLDGKMYNLYHIATMRAYDRETIINEAIKRAEDRGIQWNPEEVNSRINLFNEASAGSKNSPGTFANSVMNAKTSLSHMGGAMEALQRLQAKHSEFTDNKYAHNTMAWFNDKFGTDDDWIKLRTDLNTASTDWQNLLNNQHALTDHDKEVAKTVSGDTAPFGNSMAALQEMAHTAAARIVPLNDKWKDTMGADYPDLLNDEAVRAIKRINSPEVNRLLGDMQVGGNLRNSSTGQGTPGKKVRDLLNQPSGQQPNERPVVIDGKTVGYTVDGKTISRLP